VVTKKTTPKLATTQELHLDFVGQSKFPKKEAFIVFVASPSGQVQMTFHRPIGETPLAEDDWVATESSQTHYLLSRTENPLKKRNEANRHNWRLDQAVTKELLTKSEGVIYYFGHTGLKSRKDLIKDARSAAKKEEQTSSESYVPFLPEPVRGLERDFLDFIKSEEAKNDCALAHPLPPFETKSGVRNDQAQEAVPYLKGLTPDEARHAVINRILTDS